MPGSLYPLNGLTLPQLPVGEQSVAVAKGGLAGKCKSRWLQENEGSGSCTKAQTVRRGLILLLVVIRQVGIEAEARGEQPPLRRYRLHGSRTDVEAFGKCRHAKNAIERARRFT